MKHVGLMGNTIINTEYFIIGNLNSAAMRPESADGPRQGWCMT